EAVVVVVRLVFDFFDAESEPPLSQAARTTARMTSNAAKAVTRRNRFDRRGFPTFGGNDEGTLCYWEFVTEVTSHASLSTWMSSTTAVNVQVTSWGEPLFDGTHLATNAVPWTAAVVPPAFTSKDPVSDTLAARFQVSPTDSVPWV